MGSALQMYNGYLAALDAPYFSLWVKYRAAQDAAVARGASAAEELALQRTLFVWRPTIVDAARHVARYIKARWVFYQKESRWPSS